MQQTGHSRVQVHDPLVSIQQEAQPETTTTLLPIRLLRFHLRLRRAVLLLLLLVVVTRPQLVHARRPRLERSLLVLAGLRWVLRDLR